MKTLAILLALAAAQDDFPKVPPPDAQALEKLRSAGALALPLADGQNMIIVDFSLAGEKAGDGPLDLLQPVAAQVARLNLAGTPVTDAGLAKLLGLKNLRRLHLERTKIGDAGMAHVAKLGELRYLNLYETKVTDKGVGLLSGLKKLESLYLWKSGVTDAGAGALAKALPKTYINRGLDSVPPPSKPVVVGPAPVNAKCPFTGKAIDRTKTTVYQGQLVGFCCADCLAKFDSDPAKFAAKVQGLKLKPVVKAINAKCPLTGKAIDPAFTSVHLGQAIGFCCDNCRDKFRKDPKKYVSKVKEFKDPGRLVRETGIDAEGFIRRWLVLGPIPNKNENAGAAEVNAEQVKGEAKLLPAAGQNFEVRGQKLSWREHVSPEYFVDFNRGIGKPGAKAENVTGYLVAYVHAPKELKGVRAKWGTNDQGRLYLNGGEILKYEGSRALEKDAGEKAVTLVKGRNAVVLKVVNEGNNWQACLRFVDAKGKPIPGLKVALKP